MKRKGRVAAAVFQVLAILVLIVAIPSTCFYYAMNYSLNRALASDTVPELFGYQFVPIQTDSVSKIIDKGSLVIVSETDPKDVQQYDTILYEIPSESRDNIVYENYAISTVQGITYGSDMSYIVKSYDNPAAEGIVVSSSLLKGNPGWTVAYLGGLTEWVMSPFGLLFFVVLPVGAFLLLQLISILIRVLGKPVKPSKENEEEEINIEQLLDKIEIEQPKVSSEPQIKSQTVSSMESQIGTYAYSAPSVSSAGKIGFVNSEPSAVSEDPAAKQAKEAQEKLEAFRRGGTPAFGEKKPVASGFAWKEQTIEFDTEEIREKLMREKQLKGLDEQGFVKTLESQENYDSILIEMKENSLDFNFKDIYSETVTIEKTPSGDGFVIQTQNYQATVRVDIRPR